MSTLTAARKATTKLVLAYLRDCALRGDRHAEGRPIIPVEFDTPVAEVRRAVNAHPGQDVAILIRRGDNTLVSLYTVTEPPAALVGMKLDECADEAEIGMVWQALVARGYEWSAQPLERKPAIGGRVLAAMVA